MAFYDRCSPRRKIAIRIFAQRLAELEWQAAQAEVIRIFPK